MDHKLPVACVISNNQKIPYKVPVRAELMTSQISH